MMIYDIHCHLLPGLDDGAFFIDESISMAEIAKAHRSGGIVCTPHKIRSDDYSKQTLLEVFSKTRDTLNKNGINIKLALGQEILLNANYKSTLALLEAGELFTINNSVYPLVEFDPFENINSVYAMIEDIVSRGFIPIIAHPERYEFVAEDYSTLNRLRNLGTLLQLNKGSITGFFGHSAKRISTYMLEKQIVDFVASDAHSPYRRTTNLHETHEIIAEHYSIDYANHLLSENPLRVLNNKKIYNY